MRKMKQMRKKKKKKESKQTENLFFIIQKQEEIIPIIDLKSEKEIILPQVANIDLNYQHAIKTLKKEKQKNRKIVNFKELLYSYENDKYSIRIKKKYTKTEGNTDEDLNILKPKSSKDFQSNKKTKTQASIDEKINIIYELRNSILNLQNRKNQLEEAVIKVIKQKKEKKFDVIDFDTNYKTRDKEITIDYLNLLTTCQGLFSNIQMLKNEQQELTGNLIMIRKDLIILEIQKKDIRQEVELIKLDYEDELYKLNDLKLILSDVKKIKNKKIKQLFEFKEEIINKASQIQNKVVDEYKNKIIKLKQEMIGIMTENSVLTETNCVLKKNK